MQVLISKWGNSLGVRVPKDVAAKLGLGEGSRVDVSVEGDRITIEQDGTPVVIAHPNIGKARLIPDYAALGIVPTKPEPEGLEKPTQRQKKH